MRLIAWNAFQIRGDLDKFLAHVKSPCLAFHISSSISTTMMMALTSSPCFTRPNPARDFPQMNCRIHSDSAGT